MHGIHRHGLGMDHRFEWGVGWSGSGNAWQGRNGLMLATTTRCSITLWTRNRLLRVSYPVCCGIFGHFFKIGQFFVHTEGCTVNKLRLTNKTRCPTKTRSTRVRRLCTTVRSGCGVSKLRMPWKIQESYVSASMLLEQNSARTLSLLAWMSRLLTPTRSARETLVCVVRRFVPSAMWASAKNACQTPALPCLIQLLAGAQFFLRDDDIGKSRAAASAPRIQALNPFASVEVVEGTVADKEDAFFAPFNVVILINQPYSDEVRVNNACRTNGLYAYIDSTSDTLWVVQSKYNRKALTSCNVTTPTTL